MAVVPINKKPFISARDFPSWQQQNLEMKRTLEAFNNTLLGMDAFSNPAARLGFGTNNLNEGVFNVMTRLTHDYWTLQTLFRNDWIVQKVIKSVADDQLKNWIKIVTDLPPKQIQRFNNAIDDTLTIDKIRDAMYWGRLYGGAAAIIIIKGHGKKLDKPLNFEDVEPGSYLGLIPFDRWSGITPSAQINTDINDPANFALPESYRITTESASSYEVHSSRVLRFLGRKLPNWERQYEMYWAESEVEVFYEELKKRNNTSWNLASLIFRANILSIRQKDLSQMLSGLGANQNALKNFTAAMRAITDLMSNQGMMILPEEGGLEQHSYSFSGIAEVYEQFKQDICGATEYPYSRLFGKPSGGMGTTNEGDEHTYFDNVAAKQKSEVDPQLRKLLPVVAMSVWGEVPKDFSWIWNPVRSLSNEEQAEMGSKKTTSIIEAYNANVITQRVAAKELKQQAEESNLFSNIDDEMIEETDDKFTNPADEMGGMGMPPLGGGPEEGDTEQTEDPETDEKEVGKKVKRGKSSSKKDKPSSEQTPKKGPSKSGGGEIPKVQTSKPKRGKDSLEGFLARIKNAYNFGGELAKVHKQHDNGTYTLRIKGKDFLAQRDSFDFVDVSAAIPEKLSKASVHFESPAQGKDHCRDCVHYLSAKTQCQIVEGTDIFPKDWCEEFETGVARQLIDASKTVAKGLNKFKSPEEERKAARKNPEQKSLYGGGHTKELQEYYRKASTAKDEDTDTERHLRFNGLDIYIENEVGSIRAHAKGEQLITVPYGYISGTSGVDGDRVDCFVGPFEDAVFAYVVHIKNPETGNFDEDKCFLGFASAAAAKAAFEENYSKDPKAYFESMEKIPFLEFVDKLRQRGKKIVRDTDFREDQHPRDDGGKFSTGSGGGSAPDASMVLKKKLSGSQGSNRGGVYEGSDGKKRYVKFYKDKAQGQSEVLANSIYNDLGVNAPQAITFEDGDKEAFASEIIEGGTLLGDMHITPDIAKKVMEGFAADVLLKNWDAVGLDADNILVKDGQVYRIDNGGSLLFRAQGERKHENDLGSLDELDRFFDRKTNYAYAYVAHKAGYHSTGDMGKDFHAQLEKISDLVEKFGGWESYVRKAAPSLRGSDFNRTVKMLEDRTKKLTQSSSVTDADFEESKHPRAKEGSKGGQFVKKGEGGEGGEGGGVAHIKFEKPKPKVPEHPPKEGYKWSNAIFSNAQEALPSSIAEHNVASHVKPKQSEVKADELIPTNEQVPSVKASKPQSGDKISVIKNDGKLYLWKGHQKAMTEIEEGKKDLSVTLYDMDDLSAVSFGETPSDPHEYGGIVSAKKKEEPDLITPADVEAAQEKTKHEEESEGVQMTGATVKMDVGKFLKSSDNQKKVLGLYASGKSTGTIAKQLGLPHEKATRAKLRNLLRKQGVYKDLAKAQNLHVDDVPKTELALAANTFAGKVTPDSSSYSRDNNWAQFMGEVGVSESAKQKVTGMYSSWSGSSNSAGGIKMKSIAAKFYGKNLSAEPLPAHAKAQLSDIELNSAEAKAMIAAKEYAGAWVKKHGEKAVYRGMSGTIAQKIKDQVAQGKTEIDITENTLGSWSTSKARATSFSVGGIVMKMKVNPDDVWGTYDSTPGPFHHQSEREYIMGISQPTLKLYVNKTSKGYEYSVAGTD
jgi:phage-related protein (TIGR01555 family)